MAHPAGAGEEGSERWWATLRFEPTLQMRFESTLQAFQRQRRGMCLAQSVSPGTRGTQIMNSLSLRERGRVREALKE